MPESVWGVQQSGGSLVDVDFDGGFGAWGG